MFNTKLYAEAAKLIPQKYLLTNLVSMRARQLQEGVDPLVDPEDLSFIDIALKEITEGMISPKAEETIDAEDLFA